jgi:hypothetical protein
VRADALQPVLREFARSRAWWRRPLQYAYATAATHRPTAAWLAGPRVTVTPPVEDADGLVIIGGNHHIRIADVAAGAMHVILKVGRDPRLVGAELALRRAAPYLPIPPLLRVREDQGWYTEELVPGRPLNRLPERRERSHALRVARAALERLLAETGCEVPRAVYVAGLLEHVRRALACTRVLAGWRDRLDAVAHALAHVAGSSTDTLAIAQTHGDLQPGNVLAAAGRTWIVDWEYTARRQSGFDALTYGLGSRFPTALASRACKAVLEGGPGDGHLLHDWPGLAWETRAARGRAVAVFLLEELGVRLRENADTVCERVPRGAVRFFGEIERVARELPSLAA